MGSAKVTNISNMAEEKKKSIKCIIKNFFGKKKDKDKDYKDKDSDIRHKDIRQETPKAIPVETLLENFKKLEIEKQKHKEEKDELENFSFNKVQDDELDNFTVKVVETERRTERTGRIESHSSQDSGFSEKDVDDKNDDVLKSSDIAQTDNSVHIKDEKTHKEDEKKEGDVKKVGKDVEKEGNDVTKPEEDAKEDEVIESMQNLKIEDGKKKTQVVPLRRGPMRNKVADFAHAPRPYGLEADNSFRQINQVNKHTFSGGQVIVASRLQSYPAEDHKDDTNQELQHFADGLAMCGVQLDGQPFDLDIIQEYLDEKTSTVPETSIPPASMPSIMMSPTSMNMSPTSMNMSPTSIVMSPTSTLMSETSLMESETSNLIDEFIKDPNCQEHLQTISTIVQKEIENENPIEELENTNHLNYEPIESLDSLLGLEEDRLYSNIFPTPPSAENLYSPKNDVYNHFLTPPRSDTALSPMSDTTLLYQTNSDYSLSPKSDCEKYQEIPQFTEDISFVSEHEESTDKKGRERNPSTSSLSMKNFKDMQKELAAGFTKKECCQINRKPCKQIFQEHLKNLKPEERKSICLKVASMDLKTVYGVLHHVLLGLSRGTPEEDLHLALFPLLCERVLTQKPQLFLEDFGLSLLKAATMRCPQRPLMARYLVQCIRTAVKLDPAAVQGKDCLYREVDAQGDTLVTACARAGDSYAAVLAELLRRDHNDLPLFNVQHGNTEGYSALHVACRQHTAAAPCLHVVHVLLEHGGADIWKGDSKGGDTAVHMAVNSASCELQLVLLLFRHLDRKLWKKLAHVPNRSSVTPLDYARCAAKSTTRQNYPPEVLDFLKKCR
uniref:Uncharacterized protein n=1 Tax=Pectinophora gossypiella TaxID=13191 RepID=A0A1E1W5H6_PECGO